MQNIFWLWPRKAFADVEEICHHKNCEDGGFGTDQAVHPDASSRRETPVEITFLEACG
jgi:hypothetical protein